MISDPSDHPLSEYRMLHYSLSYLQIGIIADADCHIIHGRLISPQFPSIVY